MEILSKLSRNSLEVASATERPHSLGKLIEWKRGWRRTGARAGDDQVPTRWGN